MPAPTGYHSAAVHEAEIASTRHGGAASAAGEPPPRSCEPPPPSSPPWRAQWFPRPRRPSRRRRPHSRRFEPWTTPRRGEASRWTTTTAIRCAIPTAGWRIWTARETRRWVAAQNEVTFAPPAADPAARTASQPPHATLELRAFGATTARRQVFLQPQRRPARPERARILADSLEGRGRECCSTPTSCPTTARSPWPVAASATTGGGWRNALATAGSDGASGK